MAKIKTTEPSGIVKGEIIDVPISLLRITPDVEGVWLTNWIKENGDSIKESPAYLYLEGDYEPLRSWCDFHHLPSFYLSQKLMEVLKSIIYEGQKEPILLYRDMRINTGHKRAACMLYLGAKTIKAIIVSDDYKL